MKKKILIGAFLLLVLITAIIFIVAAIDSYNYDMNPANSVDILEGVPTLTTLTPTTRFVYAMTDLSKRIGVE